MIIVDKMNFNKSADIPLDIEMFIKGGIDISEFIVMTCKEKISCSEIQGLCCDICLENDENYCNEKIELDILVDYRKNRFDPVLCVTILKETPIIDYFDIILSDEESSMILWELLQESIMG